MPLTDTAIRVAKPAQKRTKLFDGGGLHVEVSPRGTKTWKLSYRFDGREKVVTGGRYPEMSLAEARLWREQTKALLRGGTDPSAAIRGQKIEAVAETFEDVACEWFGKHKYRWKPAHAARVWARIEGDAFAVMGQRLIGKVSHRDVLDLIVRFEQRKALDLGRRVVQYVARIMAYAVATGRATHNPVPDTRGAMAPRPKVQHHARLPTRLFPEFFRKLAASEHDKVTKMALRWTILTMGRTAETRFFRPEEIEGRGTDALTWRIPGKRMKMGREHIVPLPAQAAPLLEMIEFHARRDDSPWQFPQVRNAAKPIDENVMLYCLHDLGFKGVATVHGFRGVASTLLNEQVNPDGSRRFDKDWIEMQLAHAEESEVRGAYNAAEYIGPRRRMMQWWADYLEESERLGSLL